MKISNIRVNDVAEFIRADDYNEVELQHILDAARSYIRSYTGLDDAQLDENEDFYIALMVLCQDMYDNRSMYIDTKAGKNSANRAIDTILGMHCVNLL